MRAPRRPAHLAGRLPAEPKQAGRGAELEERRLPLGGDREPPLEVLGRTFFLAASRGGHE
jgi:hypothetical protein